MFGLSKRMYAFAVLPLETARPEQKYWHFSGFKTDSRKGVGK